MDPRLTDEELQQIRAMVSELRESGFDKKQAQAYWRVLGIVPSLLGEIETLRSEVDRLSRTQNLTDRDLFPEHVVPAFWPPTA